MSDDGVAIVFHFMIPNNQYVKASIAKGVQLMLFVFAGFPNCALGAEQTPTNFVIGLSGLGVETRSVVLNSLLQTCVDEIVLVVPAFVPDVELRSLGGEIAVPQTIWNLGSQGGKEVLGFFGRPSTHKGQGGRTISIKHRLAELGQGFRLSHKMVDPVLSFEAFALPLVDFRILADATHPISFQAGCSPSFFDGNILQGAVCTVVSLESSNPFSQNLRIPHRLLAGLPPHLIRAFRTTSSVGVLVLSKTRFDFIPPTGASKYQSLIAPSVIFGKKGTPPFRKERTYPVNVPSSTAHVTNPRSKYCYGYSNRIVG